MELAELILKYIEVLKYPVLIIVVLICFRNQFRLLLSGKLSAKYKDLELTLEQKSTELRKSRSLKQSIVEEIESKIAQLDAEAVQQPVVTSIRELLDKLKQNLTYWESTALDFITLCERQPVPKYWIVEGLIEDADPWRKHKDVDLVVGAIESLMVKGLIQKVTEDKGEYFRVHSLLSERKADSSTRGSKPRR